MTNEIKEYAFRKKIEDIGFKIIKLDYFFKQLSSIELTRPHKINFYAIICITKGKGKHSIDFKSYDYGKGSVFFVEKNQIHAWEQHELAEGFIILFTEDYLYNNQVKFQDISYTYPYNDSLYEPIINLNQQEYKPFYALITYLFQEYHLQNSPNKQEILQNLLRTILLKIRSYPSKEYKGIDSETKELFIRFQKELENKIAITRNAKDYCIFLNTSYRKLNTTCKTLTNKTIKEFIDYFLILKAKRLLSEKGKNISEISYKLGFDEITNFTKFFKKHTTQTPKSFYNSVK
ncbi:AraC family transcriptional regulator [Tamlana agarivorans]|uniref:AraC family transcriptional regulator n=1 Tax=Pseudotamlana agarivorans TaxID=481183 RepID=A0ACC5U7D6_9FLAO|nr:helix-turn-helix domain-containing protein [Tamlana agarivorans]MBU2950219.1 AraC family transcriptional regulator [Tamlana agarivorans]